MVQAVPTLFTEAKKVASSDDIVWIRHNEMTKGERAGWWGEDNAPRTPIAKVGLNEQ